jgi:uncharacterized LabA/DUF88 family protein
MDRYSVFIDAGYFYAVGAQAAFGLHLKRKQVALKDPLKASASLIAEAGKLVVGQALLRIYWYDAMPGPRLTMEQSELALLDNIKLRLGALNSMGEQKGVDSLIVTDLIELSRNGAIKDAVLLSGDEDLRIAVQLAQSFGVRVHLLAAGDGTKNVSPALRMEADSTACLSPDWFREHLRQEPMAETAAQGLVIGLPFEEACERAVEQMLGELRPEQKGALCMSRRWGLKVFMLRSSRSLIGILRSLRSLGRVRGWAWQSPILTL